MHATGIRLDSAERLPIDNYQEVQLIPANIRASLEAQYLPLIQPDAIRTELTPRYNCHGLTFASRRTQITDTPTIFQILREDKYEEVKPPEPVKAGDIILYFGDYNEAMHSGIVVEPVTLIPGAVRIVSKWGIWREVVHYSTVGPYAGLTTRYYRIKNC